MFLFFALARERISIKMHRIEIQCYRTRKYTVCRHVRASFSPEILQAVAVEGLRTMFTYLLTDLLEQVLNYLNKLNRKYLPRILACICDLHCRWPYQASLLMARRATLEDYCAGLAHLANSPHSPQRMIRRIMAMCVAHLNGTCLLKFLTCLTWGRKMRSTSLLFRVEHQVLHRLPLLNQRPLATPTSSAPQWAMWRHLCLVMMRSTSLIPCLEVVQVSARTWMASVLWNLSNPGVQTRFLPVRQSRFQTLC